jgi:acetyl-CoA acyltransferase
MPALREAVIVDAVRTPIGKRNGSLRETRPDDLAAQVLRALVERTGVDPAAVEDVVMGCVTQIGEQGYNVGRIASMIAGFPETVAGTSVNRMCGSSLQAAMQAAHAVMTGTMDVVVAAGVENMSRVLMGSDGGSLSDRLLERYQLVPQGLSAELIAERWGFSRDELDAYSLRSHERALRAIDEGRFAREIVPVDVTVNGATVTLDIDETPRRDTSAERLANLDPAFKPDGVITAGNASQICDGASAALITTPEHADRLGLRPRARFVSFAVSGVDPVLMLHGNPLAVRKALDKAGRIAGTTSTRTARGSRWATRSARPARGSWPACSPSSTGATAATALPRCASAGAWRSAASWSAFPDLQARSRCRSLRAGNRPFRP